MDSNEKHYRFKNNNERNKLLSQRKKNNFGTKVTIVFVTYLLYMIISIRSKYSTTLIASPTKGYIHNDRNIRENQSKDNSNDKGKLQKVVVLYGPTINQIQKDLSTWTKEFQLYPWAWALPDISSEKYTKEQHFGPFLDSIKYFSAMAPMTDSLFDVNERNLAEYSMTKFKDGFRDQWVQNKSIIIGSNRFSYILDETNGDSFMDAFIQTMPWKDPRYALLNEGEISVIILHQSSHKDHIKELWLNNIANNPSQKKKFSSWITHDFDFNIIDSYSLAYNFIKRGFHVSVVDVNNVEKDLSHFVLCTVLNFPCGNGYKGSSNHEKEQIKTSNIDVTDLILDHIEQAIRMHESRFLKCFNKYQNLIQFYPQRNKNGQYSSKDSGPCPTLNQSIKQEIREIVTRQS